MTQETEGDIRFFHDEDKIYANSIKDLIEKRLKEEKINQGIKILNFSKKYENIPRGDIEVWFPPLKYKNQGKTETEP